MVWFGITQHDMKRENEKTIGEMRADSPFPWTVVDFGMGHMDLVDANGVVVPLLRTLALVTTITAHMATQQGQKEGAETQGAAA